MVMVLAQPKAGTGHKMQTVSVFFSTLHCEGYTADLRCIAGSLLLGVLAGSLKSDKETVVLKKKEETVSVSPSTKG